MAEYDKVSNKTLATLLVVLIVITLAGVFFTMRNTSLIEQAVASQCPAGYVRQNMTGSCELNTSTCYVTETCVEGEGNHRMTMIIRYTANATGGVAQVHKILTVDDETDKVELEKDFDEVISGV
jgi:hypothetical protein